MVKGKLEGWGDILWIKTNAAGDALAGGAINGSILTWNGKKLASADSPDYLTWILR
jgi:hypothetical protein